ncbi:helix-turn-helix domain-containing protein [Streptomyces sp. NPDC046316]|uniref:helix-turn-helix domain-containing protein n=1 Tax=Streptomyces sp. NPDC046316 TaxID=3154494 RepID=UPI0033F421AC
MSTSSVLSRHSTRAIVFLMTQSPTESAWSERLALSIAKEVRRHRQAQGLSAQQLSDRCADLGMPVQRSVLANLESGRRSTVTVAEVIVLAAALRIAPAELVFPVGYEEKVEVLPGYERTPLTGLEWFAGQGSVSGTPEPDPGLTPIRAARTHGRVVRIMHRKLSDRMRMRGQLVEVSDRREVLRARLEALREERTSLEAAVHERTDGLWGVPLAERPPLTPEEVDQRERLQRVREEERSVRAALQEIQFLAGQISAIDKELERYADALRRLRNEIEENGWLAPRLPDDLYEFVHKQQEPLFFLDDEEEPLDGLD